MTVRNHRCRSVYKLIGRSNKSDDASWQGIGSSLVASEEGNQAISQYGAACRDSAAQYIHHSGEHTERIDGDTESVLGGNGAHVGSRVQVTCWCLLSAANNDDRSSLRVGRKGKITLLYL